METDLEYTREKADATDHLYEGVKAFVPIAEWLLLVPTIFEINKLKREKNAVILAHNYMTPDIFNTVADFRGDSLQLAQEASRTSAAVIVQAGVHFMAETSKILSPEKTVLIPDMRAGCSLAESITGADVRRLREANLGLPIVTYVNTSAEVKAESDICCTSSNAVAVVEHVAKQWGVKKVIMIPDKFLAQNTANESRIKELGIKIIEWHGTCMVHERFSPKDIAELRDIHEGIVILAHPECPVEVIAAADFHGSTSAMIKYVEEKRPEKVFLLTECSMSQNVATKFPGVHFEKPCNMCPHMKRITLEGILKSLQTMTHKVEVEESIRVRAKKAIDAMLAVPM